MNDDIETDATKEDVVVPDVQQDLINDLLSDEPVKEEVQEEEEVVEETAEEEIVKEESKETEEEVTEEKEETKVEEEEIKEEDKEKPSEEEEEVEVTDDDPLQAALERNERLSDQIIAMAEQGMVTRSPNVKETVTEETEEAEELPETIKLEELKVEDFLTTDELDRVNDNPELLNEAFGRAMKELTTQLNTALKVIAPLQQEVRALPKQVGEAVGEQMNFNTFVNSFYKDNPELEKASKVVYMQYRSLMTDAQKEGKKTTIGELYDQAGDEVREMLSISKEPKKSVARKPALKGANTPKRQQKTQKTSSEAKTQAELMAYLATPD